MPITRSQSGRKPEQKPSEENTGTTSRSSGLNTTYWIPAATSSTQPEGSATVKATPTATPSAGIHRLDRPAEGYSISGVHDSVVGVTPSVQTFAAASAAAPAGGLAHSVFAPTDTGARASTAKVCSGAPTTSAHALPSAPPTNSPGKIGGYVVHATAAGILIPRLDERLERRAIEAIAAHHHRQSLSPSRATLAPLPPEGKRDVPSAYDTVRGRVNSETRSIQASSKKSTRSLRLAKARQELLQLQIQEASNRVAMIEAEDTDEEEAPSVVTKSAKHHRVSQWVEETEQQLLAIDSHSHQQTVTLKEEVTNTADFIPELNVTMNIQAPANALQNNDSLRAPIEQQIAETKHQETSQFVPPQTQQPLQYILPEILQTSTLPQFAPSQPPQPSTSLPQYVPPQPTDSLPCFVPPQSQYTPPRQPPLNQQYSDMVRQQQPPQLPRPQQSFQQQTATGPSPPMPTANRTELTVTNPRIDLTELAAAITMAARTGQQSRVFAELPVFAGAYQEWLSFRAAYCETANSYTDYENLARLRKCLRGRAKEAVESLLNYSTHPHEIMKTLELRFGRPDVIALAELDRLKSLPRPTDAPKDICVFATKVSNITATLRALDRVHYLYNPEVTKSTLEKLPSTMKYRWYDFAAESTDEEPDLLKLTRFLEREAARCGPYAAPETSHFDSRRPPLTTVDNRRPPNTYNRTYATTEPKKTEKKTESQRKECPVCENTGHEITDCKQFKDADSDGRWEIAKTKELCFRCLKKRTYKHVCRAKPCSVDGCTRYHNSALHFEKKTQSTNAVVASTWSRAKSHAFLKILPVRVTGPCGEINTYALLDDGSTVSLIDEDLSQQLGAEGPTELLNIESLSRQQLRSTSRKIKVTLHSEQTDNEAEIQVRTYKNLTLSPQRITDSDIEDCSHLEDIYNYIKYDKAVPKVLIGQDNWHLLTSTEIRKGNRQQPVATKTHLGWVLHGAHLHGSHNQIHYVNHIYTEEEDINEQLKQHFAIESLMINPKQPSNDYDAQALDILQSKTVRRQDGRYEVPLLWKRDSISMPDSRAIAQKRLTGIEKKIDKNSSLKEKYEEQMDSLLLKGYAEKAPETATEKLWYLPHFAVLNPAKPDKVRVVHDAAAKSKGKSLNDYLLTGPDLLQSLPGVMMRFRQHKYAITGDIREMFMQVKIIEEDRDALRYLWRRSDRREEEPTEYRMTSLIFGATSSPATAIFVKNLNAERYKDTYPEAYDAIVNSHYVDDYLRSFPSEEMALAVTEKVRDIHKEAGFELTQWASNSKGLLNDLGSDRNESHPVKMDTDINIERVLGLVWKPDTDELTFNLDMKKLPAEIKDAPPTKRNILRTVMSLFDPLGFASPITMRAKHLLQELWRRGTQWDSRIDLDLVLSWRQWCEFLQKLADVKIPRCYTEYSTAQKLELHIFVDSSEEAYAAALYWRITTSTGDVKVSLVTAKSRVAPLKLTSVPRLELQAAVMGVRLATTVQEEHNRKPDARFFWTDSKTVLTWIRSGSRNYRPFVAHRIAAIEEGSKVDEWRWVPTKQNVADDATRDVPTNFNISHRWFQGPEFLKTPEKDWPLENSTANISTGEEKTKILTTVRSQISTGVTPDVNRFSKWERLWRSTARVLQFIDLIRPRKEKINYKRTRVVKHQDETWKPNIKRTKLSTTKKITRREDAYKPLDGDTLKRAEKLLFTESQKEVFSAELKQLNSGKIVDKESRLFKLSVQLTNGIIYLRSRIEATEDIESSMKTPMILDGHHKTVRLYIEYVHRKLLHAGSEHVVNECRQYYYILRLRPTVRTIVTRCLPCRKRKNPPTTPPTGNHLKNRLAHHKRPFTYTGVDYFGPLNITAGRQTQKRWVALYTCLTTRAVHLEVATTLSTDSMIMTLRRMIARRGCPTEIWSDNGTNMTGADKELRKAIDQVTAVEAAKRTIVWKFIPPGAPFMGGAWERLVRSVKTALYTALTEKQPTEEVLITLLAEAEFTVNNRPLTHVSIDPMNPEALTPNHFLLGGSATFPTPGQFDEKDIIGKTHWRASQYLADVFWRRWVREYLPDLQYRREPRGRGPALKEGDVVLVADGNLPRNTWPLGLVTATYPGPDGVVRAVDVRTMAGILRRPTKKLVLLPTEAPAAVTPAPAVTCDDSTSTHGGSDVQDGQS